MPGYPRICRRSRIASPEPFSATSTTSATSLNSPKPACAARMGSVRVAGPVRPFAVPPRGIPALREGQLQRCMPGTPPLRASWPELRAARACGKPGSPTRRTRALGQVLERDRQCCRTCYDTDLLALSRSAVDRRDDHGGRHDSEQDERHHPEHSAPKALTDLPTHLQALQPRPCRGRGFGGTHPVEPTQVLDLLGDEHARVQAPFLGHVAETASFGRADRRPVPPDRADVRIDGSDRQVPGDRP